MFPSPVTLIPTYPDLPMEDVYPRVAHTTTRELYLRDLGRSRVAYIPWDIDRTFWDVMCVDHLRLLRNAIAWAANEPPPAIVEGPGHDRRDGLASARLDDRASGQPDEPDDDERTAARSDSRRPAARQRAAADGARPKKVQLLTAGKTVDYKLIGTVCTMTVPSVDVHEVVAIDL